MRKSGIRLLLTVLLGPPAFAETLDLYTFQAPPYQVVQTEAGHSMGATGTTVSTLECISRAIGWRNNIRVVPQNRAIHALELGIVDGIFAIGESSRLEAYASATAPIALEKWYFFTRRPIADFHSARLSAIAGSNEARWLRRHDYPVLIEATSTEQLLALLDRKRVDAIVVDWHVMASYLKSRGAYPATPDAQFQSTFIRFAPLSLYVSQRFTARYPEFLGQFNHHLDGCVSTDFELLPPEQRELETLARSLLRDLRSTVDVTANILARDRHETLASILNLDSQWQALAPYAPSQLANQLLTRPVSRQLAKWQAGTNGLVSETFLMDDLGAITALSQLTSDYWQGDEAKFRALTDQPTDRLVVSPIYFDDSSKRFQVTVSQAVISPATGKFIGAIALGLDVERALQMPGTEPAQPSPPAR